MRILKLVSVILVIFALTGCDAIGKSMASKSFKDMQKKIVEQEIEIAALQQRLMALEREMSDGSRSESEQVQRDEKRKQNIKSLFSREN